MPPISGWQSCSTGGNDGERGQTRFLLSWTQHTGLGDRINKQTGWMRSFHRAAHAMRNRTWTRRGWQHGMFLGCPSSWWDDICAEKDVKWANWGEELSRPKERQVQSSWGRDMRVVFKKRSPGWTELSEEDNSVKWDQRLYMSTGVGQALEATRGSLAFSPPFMENRGTW